MSTENIQINIREDGSRVAVINITAIANASANAGRQVDFLGMAFRRLAIGMAIKAFVDMADQVTLLEARLKLATKSASEFNQAQEDIYRMSQTNNVGLAETTKLYTKLSDPIRRLGGGMNEITGIVDGFSTALRIGGANTQEAAAATLQFSQAMSKGKLDGDEFKTLAETAPRVMRALADSLGVATGELKTMGSQGKLTSEVIGNGMINQLKTLKAEAAGLANTVGGSFSDLRNDAMITAGAFDKMTGTTSMMADVIQGASYLVFQLGKVFKDELADGTELAEDRFAAMTPVITALGYVFEALILLGSDISFIFKAIGREIGGVAAQVTALMNRDWDAVGNIRQQMIKDGEIAFSELERFQKRVTGITNKALAQREKAKNGGAPVDNIDYVTLKTVATDKDLIGIRMKLTGVNKTYMEDLGSLQNVLAAGNITQKEYIRLVSELATKTYEASTAGKEARKSLKGAAGSDDRMKQMQDNLVKAQTVFEREESIFGKRNEMLDMYHNKFNMSDAEFYAGREIARKEFIVAEEASFAREKAIVMSFKPKNNNEVADQQLRLSKLVNDHEDFNNKMAGLRTDDLLDRMGKDKAMQDASDDAINKYLSGQYETLQGLKEVTQAREVSKSSIERENVAILEQALANMKLQASLPVGINGRTQADQDHAVSSVNFLQSELDLRKGISAELEKQENIKNSKKAAEQLVADWKNAGKDIADSFGSTFGSIGDSFGNMMKSFTEGVADHMQIMNRLAEATKGMSDEDPRKIDAVKKAKLDSAKAQMKSYGDMAGAAKGFFKENTKGYQVLETTEKAFRAFELALAFKSMMEKIMFKEGEVAANLALNSTKIAGETAATGVSTGLAATEASAWGITAVVKAIASLPFPANLAAGAATLAAIVAIGAKIFGSVGGGSKPSISEQRQKSQGTGSILGDKDAKSESIKNAIELAATNSNIELTHTAGMLRALLSIESSIGNFAALVVRDGNVTGDNFKQYNKDGIGSNKALGAVGAVAGGVGGAAAGAYYGMGAGAMVGGPIGMAIGAVGGAILGFLAPKLAGKIFGGKQTVTDSGFGMSQQTVGNVAQQGANGWAYGDIETDGGWFRSDKTSRKWETMGADANQQFTAIITSTADAIVEAGKLMGQTEQEIRDRVNSFNIDVNNISLKDKTGKEIEEIMSQVFSKMGDDMAKFSVVGLEKFQKVGEGYLETLVRVAANFANVNSIFQSLGKSTDGLKAAGIAASERLVFLAGGIDQLAGQAASFAENYMTEAERLAPLASYVATEMRKLDLGWVNSREEFKRVALSIDTTTEAGARQFAGLMALESAFAKTHAATADLAMSEQALADQRKDLQERLDEMIMNTAQRRAKERASLAAENRPLFDQIAAREDLISAYERESEAMRSTVDHLADFQRTVLSFRDSMALGSQSTLTPVEKAAEAERQYNDMLAKAQAGDKNAQAGITSAASAYLTATQVINASNEKQNGIFERVRADMAALAATAGLQMTEAQQQLDAMERQVSGIITLNQTVLSFQDALFNVLAADRAMVTGPDVSTNMSSVTPIVAILEGLRADNAKLLEDNAELTTAINLQTEILAQTISNSGYQNAVEVNRGAERVNRAKIWEQQTTEQVG